MLFSKENPPARIYLTGFMGSGKSFYGEKLAARLGWQFTDLDEVVERAAGQPIAQIFEAEGGRDRFRELEREALRATFFSEKTVVATGGGAPLYFDNMDEMLAHGLVVYLKTPAQLLASRLLGEKERRPLIAHVPDEFLEGSIRSLLIRRRRAYRRAHLAIEQRRNDPAFLEKMVATLAPFGLF